MNLNLILRFILEQGIFLLMYLTATPLIPAKPSVKDCAVYVLFINVENTIGIVLQSTYGVLYGPVSFILSFALVFVQMHFVFHLKGKRLLFCSAGHLLTILVSSGMSIAVNGLLFGFDYVAESADTDILNPINISLINIVVLSFVWLILRWAFSLIRGDKKQSADWIPLARSLLMLATTVAAAVILLRDVTNANPDGRVMRIMFTFLLASIMLFTVIGTLMQELHNLQLRRWGETLEREKETNEALVKELRVFRHNIINMLHGFRGVLAAGNTSEQAAYYESLARDLARLNNENALALQRLKNPALSSLLMEKLNEATHIDLPMYLYTKGSPTFRNVEGKQLCAAAGALIDNAIEAAKESEAGSVRVQISEEEDGNVLTVINTYPECLDVDAFLSGNITSTKAGHLGLGLKSVEDIARRTPQMSFLRRHIGRYIECVLIWNE